MGKIENYESFLKRVCKTPQMSFEIQDKLVKKFKISNQYAKVIISLASKNGYIYPSIYNGNKLLFDSGSLAYSSNSGNIQFRELLSKHKPYLESIIKRMESNNGIISYLEVVKMSGCLIKGDKKHRNFKYVLNELRFFYNIETYKYNEQYFIIDKSRFKLNVEELSLLESKESIKCKLLYCTIIFLQKLNIIQGSPLYRNYKKPYNAIIKNDCFFDAFSFSNIKNVESNRKSIALIDYYIDSMYDINMFNGFKQRVGHMIFSTKEKNRNILAIIICNKIDAKIEQEAKNLGYLIIKLENIFGLDICNLINVLYELHLNNDIDKIAQALEIVDKNINLGNLKGELFERLCSDIISKLIDKKDCRFKKNIIINGIEVDCLASWGSNNIFFEFKSMKTKMKLGKYDKETNKIEENSFKKALYNFNITRKNNKYIEDKNYLCIIAANGFNSEVISNAKKQSKYEYDKIPMLVDKTKLIELCTKTDNPQDFKHDIDILNQYY